MLSNSVKRNIKAITPFNVIQGQRCQYHQKHVCDFLLVINTVSKLSQIIIQILDEKRPLRVFSPFWELRGNVHCLSQAYWKAHSGLPIRVN